MSAIYKISAAALNHLIIVPPLQRGNKIKTYSF
jgi:hypothetical protein